MNSLTLIENCKLPVEYPHGSTTNILLQGTTIVDVGIKNPPQTNCTIIDAGSRLVSPGFIDVHIQGAGGSDVLDNSLEALQTISTTLARLGTTGFLGTTVVKPLDGNSHLRLMKEWTNRDLGGAHLLGIHLEGPFINAKRKGGLDPNSIYPSSPAELEKIYEATGSSLKMMTIAPELPGNLDIIRLLNQHGTIPSFAHSDATYNETKKGFEAGIRHVTHIFNAMPSLHHRNPGPITAIFEHSWITAQIISDGNHLHPAIIKLIHKNIGTRRSICITDGVQGMGLPDGLYHYNAKEYESKEGAARYLDGTLIGTTLSLGKIALKYKNFTDCSFADAIDTVTIVPATLLGIDDQKGSIAKGKDADLVILNDDFSVATTIVGGKVVYQQK